MPLQQWVLGHGFSTWTDLWLNFGSSAMALWLRLESIPGLGLVVKLIGLLIGLIDSLINIKWVFFSVSCGFPAASLDQPGGSFVILCLVTQQNTVIQYR
jgi:hypothetical protein